MIIDNYWSDYWWITDEIADCGNRNEIANFDIELAFIEGREKLVFRSVYN